MGDTDLQLDLPALGRRLRDARTERGLTQEQVAEELHVARTTVVAIEKGERRVSPQELLTLARLYGKEVNELLRPGAPLEGLATQFRVAITKTPDAQELERIAAEVQHLAEDYVELERLRGSPSSRTYPTVYNAEGLAPESLGEQVAMAERSRLGLGDGPVSQLRQVLEQDVGLRIFVLDLPSAVAGLFAFSDDAGGLAAINRKHPAERQRWSLAHEYGHFLTNRYRPEVTILRRYRRQPASERAAESFAEHFLMPATGLTRRFAELKRLGPNGVTPADLLQLSHLYQVSLQALIFRLETLRLLPQGSWDRLEHAGFRVQQARALLDLATLPPDEERLPQRYRYLAVEAFLAGQITERQFARFLRTDRLTARAVAQTLSRGEGLTVEGEVTDEQMNLSASAGNQKSRGRGEGRDRPSS